MAPECPEPEPFDPDGLPGYEDTPESDESEGADLGDVPVDLPPNNSAGLS